MVTVAIPAYNAQRFLPHGLDSVRNQTYNNLEIIIANDGSTDGTGDLCDQLASTDSRIKVLHLPHQGVGATRNALVENATGEYFYFCDVDDYIEPNLIELNIDVMIKNNLDMTIFGFVVENVASGTSDTVVMEDRLMLRAEEFKQFYREKMIRMDYGYGYLHSKFFRTTFLHSLFEKGIRFEHIPMHEDELFLNEAFKYVESACSLSQPLYHYMIYPKGNATSTYRSDDNVYSVKLFMSRISLCNEWIKDDKSMLETFRKQLLTAISYPIFQQQYYSQAHLSLKQQYEEIRHALNIPEVRECTKYCHIPLCDHPGSIFSKLLDWGFYQNQPLLLLLARKLRDCYQKIVKGRH